MPRYLRKTIFRTNKVSNTINAWNTSKSSELSKFSCLKCIVYFVLAIVLLALIALIAAIVIIEIKQFYTKIFTPSSSFDNKTTINTTIEVALTTTSVEKYTTDMTSIASSYSTSTTMLPSTTTFTTTATTTTTTITTTISSTSATISTTSKKSTLDPCKNGAVYLYETKKCICKEYTSGDYCDQGKIKIFCSILCFNTFNNIKFCFCI